MFSSNSGSIYIAKKIYLLVDLVCADKINLALNSALAANGQYQVNINKKNIDSNINISRSCSTPGQSLTLARRTKQSNGWNVCQTKCFPLNSLGTDRPTQIKIPESEMSPAHASKTFNQSLAFDFFFISSRAVIFCVLPWPADHLLHLWPFVTKRAFLCLTAKEREGISFNRKVLYRFNNFESRKVPELWQKPESVC